MTVQVPGLRPQVISVELSSSVDEFLRFRHVVRHSYAFELDPERIEHLASRLRPTFQEVKAALIAFATHLEGLAHEA